MKTFTIYFERSNGEKIKIGVCGENCDKDDIIPKFYNVNIMISHFLKKFPNFHHYYTRIYKASSDSNSWTFDVGSHTEFFHAEEEAKEWIVTNPLYDENNQVKYELCSEEFFEVP